MTENSIQNDPVDRKRKYNEPLSEKKHNLKNIPFETKKEIKSEKKKILKEKKEKKKLEKLEANKKPTALEAQVLNEVKIEVGTNKLDGNHGGKKEIKEKRLDMSYNGDQLRHDECGDSLSTPKRKKQCQEESSTPANTSFVIEDKVDGSEMVSSTAMNTFDEYHFEATGINVYDYAESRAYEIMNLNSALKEAKFAQKRRVFQKLPRHMRRRAASHDVRRLPKRLQNKSLNEKVEPKKPPSRKYKRRPRNLMEEYNRRSKLHSWLETHMWHAKRFKMIDKWGYRVPAKPRDKAFRAIYRASAQSCLLQDKSYMEVIEVIGSQELIIKGFQRITSLNCIGGIPLSDEKCVSGQCYGEEMIYTHDSYPYNVVGSAKFIWTSSAGDNSSNKKLIVICHPTISTLVMKELCVVFDINARNGMDNGMSNEDESNKYDNKEEGFAEKSLREKESKENDGSSLDVRVEGEDVVSLSSDEIKLIHHKLDFVHFSLTGPLSFQTLQHVLKLKSEEENDKIASWNPSSEIRNDRCSIHNLLVEDPRFHIPYKKQNPFVQQPCESVSTTILSSPTSLIWNELSRKKVKEEKLTDEEINNMRYKHLIPGSELPVKSTVIPVVVLQRPARSYPCDSQEEYGSGYDLILPSGWAMPFWIALVYQGARVGGVESDENISLESTSFYFPTFYPDSKVRQVEVTSLHEERLKKHYRYPPDKRMNYDKLGFKHPFSLPWIHLVEEWKNIIKLLMPEHNSVKDIKVSLCDRGIYVLREKTLLNQLKLLLSGQTGLENQESVISYLINHADSLIPVTVCPLREGVPSENATICIPNDEDLALMEVSRGELGDRLKERRHKGCKRDFPYICTKHNILLPNARTVGGNTRWIIGFVQQGGYSYTKGKGNGISFISSIALVYLLYLKKGSKLLFRNINTLDYLFSTVDILL